MDASDEVPLLFLNDTTPLGDATTTTTVLLPPGASANVFSWMSFCNSSEPHDMRENYPFPQLADAARHLDVYEVLQVRAGGKETGRGRALVTTDKEDVY